jgi:hypothetical protein
MGQKVPNFETSGFGWTHPAHLIRTPVPLTEYASTVHVYHNNAKHTTELLLLLLYRAV